MRRNLLMVLVSFMGMLLLGNSTDAEDPLTAIRSEAVA